MYAPFLPSFGRQLPLRLKLWQHRPGQQPKRHCAQCYRLNHPLKVKIKSIVKILPAGQQEAQSE